MRPVLLCLTAVLLAVTVYYGVIFDGQLPDHRLLRGKNDLVLHAGAFLALALPSLVLLNGWVAVGLLTGLAAGIEVVQMFQPGRSSAWDDFAASVGGILVAGIVVRASRTFWPGRVRRAEGDLRG